MPEENNNSKGRRRHSGLESGSRIEHYRILKKIGIGGMGEVYLAEDTRLHRQVAIKFIPGPDIVGGEAETEFLKEARSAAGVSHANIVTIFDVGVFQERAYIVMEYLSGRSLEEILSDGPLSDDKAIGIVRQLCSGLAEIHRHNIIHCDIKPSNIIIDENNRVKLLDFGIARTAGSDNLSGDTAITGSVNYISPEQANSEPLTPASDLFSLGAVLYRAVTGRMPFTGDYQAQVIYSVVNEDPPPVTEMNPNISGDLADIINLLLAKDSAKRFQSAEELLEALDQIQQGQPSEATGSRSKSASGLWFYASLAILAVVVVFGLYKILHKPEISKRPARKMVAVLPFENLGPAEDEYFAVGITDEIITKLATVKDLGVISRTSVMRYQKADVPLRRIGEELGVEYILEGTVMWSRNGDSDRIRIMPQLIRVSDDTHLWAETYDHTLTNIFKIQSQIAEDVTRALHVTLSQTEADQLQSRPTDNLEAYNFYLKGNEYFNRSWNCRDIAIAIDMYQKAISLDGEFALAFAMLARGHESYFWERCDVSENRRVAARNAAIRALELNPGLAEVHLALGYIYYHCDLDYEKALQKFREVLEHQPSHSTALTAVATVQRRVGPIQDAAENFKKSLELDPLSHLKAFDVGLTYGMMREYESAEQYLDRAMALAPDWELPYIYKAWLKIFSSGDTEAAAEILDAASLRTDLYSSKYYWWLARIIESDYDKVLSNSHPGADTVGYWLHTARLYRLMGEPDKEKAYADSAKMRLGKYAGQMSEDPRFLSQLGLAYAGLRQKDSAIYCSQKAVELLPASRDAFDALFLLVNLTEVLIIFNEYDAAVGQLEYMLTIPGFVSPAYLQADPIWKPLNDNQRYRELIESTD